MLYKRTMDGVTVAAERPSLFEYEAAPKRPVCSLRGKPVSPEQAFEIIRRTEVSFHYIEEIKSHPDYIHAWNLWVEYFRDGPLEHRQGWVLTDGTLGLDFTAIDKFPTMDEMLEGIPGVAKAFPYLDFILTISNWEEMPRTAWDRWFHNEHVPFEQKEWDENFHEAIDVGIWVHDGMIELLDRERAVWKYREYADKYEVDDRKRFVHEYHGRPVDPTINKEYLLKCVRAYGVDPAKLTGWNGKPLDLTKWGEKKLNKAGDSEGHALCVSR